MPVGSRVDAGGGVAFGSTFLNSKHCRVSYPAGAGFMNNVTSEFRCFVQGRLSGCRRPLGFGILERGRKFWFARNELLTTIALVCLYLASDACLCMTL